MKNEESLKEKTAKGLFWGGLSNGAQQVLNLVFGIFLARLLSQSDYGMVGMLTIFSLLAGSLQEGGFIAALNRKKDASHNDYNAVFWTCSLFSFCIYLLLFCCAPLIADFYDEPRLVPLARYIFIGFFITSLGIAPRAMLFRNMQVRQNAIVPFVSLLVSGLVGVGMAAGGFAYWGIATQTIVYVSMFTAMNFYYAKWHPTLPIDWSAPKDGLRRMFSPIREMFGFSSKLIVTNIVNIVNNNVFSVILGRMYSAHVVGNYTQANKWNYMGWSLISNMLYGIAQPVFAQTSSDKERQHQIFRKLVRFTAFVSFPAMLGLALVAREFIVILLGEKWLESAALLQWLCIMGAFTPLSNLLSNLLIARGHSKTFMWCTIALCAAQLMAVLFSAQWGIERMIQIYVAINILWLLVWHHFACQEIHVRLTEVMRDLMPYLLITVVLIYAAQLMTAAIDNIYLCFTIKVAFVGTAYCLVLWLLRSTVFLEAIDFLRHKRL